LRVNSTALASARYSRSRESIIEMSRAANTPKPRNIAVTIVVNRISHLGKRAALKSLFKSAQVKSS
jgi:hypothetical protein